MLQSLRLPSVLVLPFRLFAPACRVVMVMQMYGSAMPPGRNPGNAPDEILSGKPTRKAAFFSVKLRRRSLKISEEKLRIDLPPALPGTAKSMRGGCTAGNKPSLPPDCIMRPDQPASRFVELGERAATRRGRTSIAIKRCRLRRSFDSVSTQASTGSPSPIHRLPIFRPAPQISSRYPEPA